jgi:hypothetical protein
LSRRYIRKLTLYGDLLRIENAHKMIHKVTWDVLHAWLLVTVQIICLC